MNSAVIHILILIDNMWGRPRVCLYSFQILAIAQLMRFSNLNLRPNHSI